MAVMNDDLVLLARSMPSHPSDVRAVRREVREALLGAEVDGGLVADAELVASELLTNAVEQRGPEDVRVELRRRGSKVSLTVANRAGADKLPPVDAWPGLTDAAGARGRGLPIVAALSERIDVERGSGWTSITCWWTVGAD